MSIRYTRRAIRELEVKERWWQEHRDEKALFLDEVEEVLTQLLAAPDLGVRYITQSGHTVQRVLLPRTRHHLYFRREPALDRIMVLSIWGANRARGPRL